jgi:hypothetical protein
MIWLGHLVALGYQGKLWYNLSIFREREHPSRLGGISIV